jgi:hypothetical protein
MEDAMRRVVTVVLLACLLLPAPAAAQGKTDKERQLTKAAVLFWGGIGVASAGVMPAISGYPQVGLPFFAAGGGLAYWGLRTKKKAETMASVQFGIVPLRKGVAFGYSKSW